jgi:hypothetical protein
VKLTPKDREHLLEIARRGKSPARRVKRALILCQADEGRTDQQIAEACLWARPHREPTPPTLCGRRVRGRSQGTAPRPGQRRKLSGPQEAHLVALACTKAPAGHTHWTLQLLADKVVELELADAISLETVRQILKKTNLNRGRRSNGASQR